MSASPFGPGYVRTPSGSWRWAGTEGSVVALSAPAEDPEGWPDLDDTERETLHNSAEWAAFAEREADDVLRRHGYR